MTRTFALVPAGDSALVVEFEDIIDPSVNSRVIALADALADLRIPGVRDIVPTFRSVTVYFDPLRTDAARLEREVTLAADESEAQLSSPAPPLRIPVCYGGEYGPDLPMVAAHARLTESEVIRLHSATTYRVFMLGFVPGFAYMGTVDDRIATPRLDTPRTRVPAGSVGIAGRQTGVYPMETPGGWLLIGRTSARPFNPAHQPSFLFKPGDHVQFYVVDDAEYRRMHEPTPE
jgi:inhibitor of KinA